LSTVAPSKHRIDPPAAVIAMRFANDVWIMHPSHEIKLFDHLVGGSKERLRHGDAERFRSLNVDD
jgi:hypothetical protein